MKAQQQQQWHTILKLTAQMRELAVPNEKLADLSVDDEYAKQPWQAISKLELERLQLLKDFFSIAPDANDSQIIEEGIQTIQNIDQELVSISQRLQKDLGRTFSRMGDSQRAASAYASNAGQAK